MTASPHSLRTVTHKMGRKWEIVMDKHNHTLTGTCRNVVIPTWQFINYQLVFENK
jgi:hypothetical protein